MPSYLQVENLSKSYGTKVLFDSISFNINEGDKIALIAPNGTGKTSLLRILAGDDTSDSGGKVLFLRHLRVAFLEQEYRYDGSLTVWEQIFASGGEEERGLAARKILQEFGLTPDRKMSQLSGGEIKRVAITDMLSRGADFLIMDEPTNHLDLDAIEYLENYLKHSRCTLFMVTHDRYFLDRVCNTVMEMDRGRIYIYRGDYENYLQKRQERIDNYNSETDKVRNLLRRELEWIHATPCARSGKAKYRKQAFLDLSERAAAVRTESSVSLEQMGSGARLGTKVINCKGLNFGYADRLLIKDFTYNFQRFERVGIVGANGVGKSTFLNLLAQGGKPEIEMGESVQIGYYRQQGMTFREDDTVMDVVPDTRLLGRFLFPHEMYSSRISTLSGGERRRLYLLTVLMKNPNLLILDEPTNDLDIVTLNVLEEYLLSDYKGSLIVVTHDRHFLDRIVDHLFVFTGDAHIKDFVGGYSAYRTFITDLKAEKRVSAATPRQAGKPVESAPRKRLSYKQKRELEQLEEELEGLEAEKSRLEALLSGGAVTDYAEVRNASLRYEQLRTEIDSKELRCLALMELEETS